VPFPGAAHMLELPLAGFYEGTDFSADDAGEPG
jgi:hypothetical protein